MFIHLIIIYSSFKNCKYTDKFTIFSFTNSTYTPKNYLTQITTNFKHLFWSNLNNQTINKLLVNNNLSQMKHTASITNTISHKWHHMKETKKEKLYLHFLRHFLHLLNNITHPFRSESVNVLASLLSSRDYDITIQR